MAAAHVAERPGCMRHPELPTIWPTLTASHRRATPPPHMTRPARVVAIKCHYGGILHLKGLADGEDGVAREGLVDDAASHAHHRRTAVVALSVELPRLPEDELVLTNLLGRAVAQPHIVSVGVARPQDALGDDIASVLVGILLQEGDLAERNEKDDLEPRRCRERCPRRDGTTRQV